ncbi:POTRA domain-containing protein [Silvibacterium sp.]|uniref:POTRA domain-containing protein n=1 Tax=Silvibacterium sp. TaxID=1964179 RepID=UPI0039E2DA70
MPAAMLAGTVTSGAQTEKTPAASVPATPANGAIGIQTSTAGAAAGGAAAVADGDTRPAKIAQPSTAATESIEAWVGLQVDAVAFEGIDQPRLEPLPEMLPLQVGHPLAAADVRQSLRRLYQTGLYKTIEVAGVRTGDHVRIIFRGTPTFFIGRVTIDGIKSDRLSNQLQRSTRLSPGTVFTDNKLTRADGLIQETLEENGYYQGKVTRTVTTDASDAQSDVAFNIEAGKQARVGNVAVEGDAGLPIETFRKKGKLKEGSKVTRDTVSRALNNLRKNYEKKQRLEASLGLESKDFTPTNDHLNYKFQVNQGPLVTITVNGVKLSPGKVKTLVPVYEEGSVDEDLLNEGNRRIRDYYQREGYFDAQVTHTRDTSNAAHTQITFDVKLGDRHTVAVVRLKGNHYFTSDIIDARLGVQKASLLQKHGNYSQALVQADVNTITALYQSNGFSAVKVIPDVKDVAAKVKGKPDTIDVTYSVDEGAQQKIGKYQIVGSQQIPLDTLKGLTSVQSGQPYSSSEISGDRDSILTYYFSHGFDAAQLNVVQKPEADHPELIDVTMNLNEGERVYVNRVLISGLSSTRASTIEPHVLVHPGDPLDQSALLETQRQLYDLTLFNEVNAAVQNPNGDELRKNVLLQFTEARRWDVSYGFGFQAQTGNPSTNCPNPASLIQLGINPATYEASCGTNGNTGASALVLFDVSRINLWGRNQSITLRTEYGSLEQMATLVYSFPHIFNSKKFDFSLSGGYTNAQDVTTYAASRLEGTVRVTQRPSKAETLIYQFTYRRVKVNPNSVQVAPDEIPLVSEPVRVAGPGITWIRDTRRPSPLDAQSGTYTSVEEFFTDSKFSSEANYNRFDATNASYYIVGKKKYVLARSTRFGFERAFGAPQYETIPLPERLYAGGAQSMRGFSINAAGPRDSLTGFPIGGAGVFVNSTEIRFPNPTLPYFGNALGFVLFHDMGNVFSKSSDIWPSFLRTRQPHSSTCKDLNTADQEVVTNADTGAAGTCDFNYFSHAIGLGLRYHTPIGPIRLDFSYNLNPPIYPVIVTYGTTSSGASIPPYVDNAGHFNFFFSIGQAF